MTRNGRQFDVIATGGVDVDLVLTVDAIPSEGETVMGELVGRLPGGTVANFACAAARIGMQSASLASVGDDSAGRALIQDFERFGVDTSFVSVLAEVETNFTVVLVAPSGERSIVVVPMFKTAYDPEVARRAYASGRAAYMMTGQGEEFIQLAELARSEGALVMVDMDPTIGAAPAGVEDVLTRVNVACLNHHAFAAVAREQPSVAAARRLLDYGPQVVVVTSGSGGALAVTADETASVPGWKVEVRDTTGAGDTFNAAFLAGTLRREPLEKRLRFANAAAAIAVTGLGPRGHLPTRTEVERLLAQVE
jgi:sulfofructose kinase